MPKAKRRIPHREFTQRSGMGAVLQLSLNVAPRLPVLSLPPNCFDGLTNKKADQLVRTIIAVDLVSNGLTRI